MTVRIAAANREATTTTNADIEALKALQPGLHLMDYKAALKYTSSVAEASEWLGDKRKSYL